ncbi:hypothetical protein [Symbioplanes lichenis]|uniref:hypothetical protein n=1 Tax=Symbioplanes lichenis TaxID=1629072 RepID=UPI00273A3060|nr:hypothetical protein [Actinoplanes lichenis]
MSDPITPTWSRPTGPWASGTVTGVPPIEPPPTEQPPGPGPDPEQRRRRQMLLFGGIAGGIVAIGLTIILIVALASDGDAFSSKAQAPTDVRPPLAQMCPAPTTIPGDPAPAPSAPVPPASGERTVDEEAGISYKKYGAPWEPWTTIWRAGTLEVPYKVGQHFVTEQYSGGTYHASILSAAVPAAENDAVTLNLECVGRQVAADVRAEYYPQPNTIEQLRDGLTTLGGRPAYLSEFRLHFQSPGLQATAERSAVAVIDVGKPTAAVLYLSIPNTHAQFEPVIAEVLASVRPL